MGSENADRMHQALGRRYAGCATTGTGFGSGMMGGASTGGGWGAMMGPVSRGCETAAGST